MCGICGKIHFDREEPVPAALIHRMTQALVHRGPDGEGQHLDGPVGLGHRRLSIIDREGGAQPMGNEDGSVWVVFNGEIYNFQALRRDLEAQGHRFRSASDTEVIVHGYEQWGDAVVPRLEGMFALVLWDQRRQRLLLARDRVGIKPLYYARTPRALVFGSEIKALLADPSVPREVDLRAVDRFLTYGYGPGHLTPFAGIHKLAPGHTLTVEGRDVKVHRYWDLAYSTPQRPPPLEASAQSLRDLLEATVERHLVSDVPVGVLLSGGVDSTGVLQLASARSAAPLHSFTLGFGGTAVADERPFARLASQAFGTTHHEITLSSGEFRDLLPDFVWHMEELVCEPPAIALHCVARLARSQGVKVLLSGEGGDEAFAGYPEYRNLGALERLKAWPWPGRPLLDAGLGALASLGWPRARHYQDLLDRDVADYYWSRTATPGHGFNARKDGLYGEGLARAHAAQAADAPTRPLMEAMARQPLLNRLLYVDTRSWLPDDLLVKADKMSMAASVELRVPLLDHRVLEFAAALPVHHKAQGVSLKRVLRKAFEPTVPAAILQRRKAGFPVPYGQWLRRDLKDFLHDTVLSTHSFAAQHFQPMAAGRLLAQHGRGLASDKEVFSLLTLELWHQRFMASTTQPREAAA